MASHKSTILVSTSEESTLDDDQRLYLRVRHWVLNSLRDKINTATNLAAMEDIETEGNCLRIQLYALEDFDVGATITSLQESFPGGNIRVEQHTEPGICAFLLIPKNSGRAGGIGWGFPFDFTTLLFAAIIILFIAYLWTHDSDMLLIKALRAGWAGIRTGVESFAFSRTTH